jgi:hypothetical protein
VLVIKVVVDVEDKLVLVVDNFVVDSSVVVGGGAVVGTGMSFRWNSENFRFIHRLEFELNSYFSTRVCPSNLSSRVVISIDQLPISFILADCSTLCNFPDPLK